MQKEISKTDTPSERSAPVSEKESPIRDKEIEEMLKSGVQFGHRQDKKHPKMENFVYGSRNSISIIDVLKTKEYLQKAIDFLKEKIKKGAIILFVGTKLAIKNMIKELAQDFKMPYVTERWLGGTLTNFGVVSIQIKNLERLEEGKKKGDFDKYTKKERLRLDKDLEKRKRKIGGIRTLKKLPDVLFVVDVRKEKTAIEEAAIKKIPVVGICDTDSDPDSIDYPVFANDEVPSSVKYILTKIKQSLK
ncbi:MAG: 30S ribosomal protein S2 [Patescibacteria group bacterium]